MTKEVELIIKGAQKYETHEDDMLETKTAAEYYFRKGSHYIIFEEQLEGFPVPLKSMLKLKGGRLEMVRRGPINTEMVFEKGTQTVSKYKTPFGEMLLEVSTKALRVLESEDMMRIDVDYELAAEGQRMAVCRTGIQIKSKV